MKKSLDAQIDELYRLPLGEFTRARNALAVSQEHLQDAKGELATALQLPPSAVPEVVGELAVPSGAPLPYGLDQLLSSAQALPARCSL